MRTDRERWPWASTDRTAEARPGAPWNKTGTRTHPTLGVSGNPGLRPSRQRDSGGQEVSTADYEATHTITCRCCGITARVRTRRRFLCDDCFRVGHGRKSEIYSEAFDRKLTEWLLKRGDLACDTLMVGSE